MKTARVHAVAFEAATVILDTRDGTVSALIGDERHDLPLRPIAGIDPGPNWGTRVQPVALEQLAPTAPALTVAAAAALGTVLALAALGRPRRTFARHLALVRALARLRLKAASRVEIADTADAVRRIGRILPWRVACLEEATCTVLALALRGRSATWRHGVAPDPIRLHAWVTDAYGQPVAEPPETAAYTTILRIPAPTAGGAPEGGDRQCPPAS